MTRVEGERARALQHLHHLRTIVNQVIYDLTSGSPIPGPDIAQAVAHTGVDVARALSALAAFDLAARDHKPCGNVLKGDYGEQYVCVLNAGHCDDDGPETDHTDAWGLARWPVRPQSGAV